MPCAQFFDSSALRFPYLKGKSELRSSTTTATTTTTRTEKFRRMPILQSSQQNVKCQKSKWLQSFKEERERERSRESERDQVRQRESKRERNLFFHCVQVLKSFACFSIFRWTFLQTRIFRERFRRTRKESEPRIEKNWLKNFSRQRIILLAELWLL